jgi:hypothetical protein
MAHNLMFLKCKMCGEKFCIAKYYPFNWFRHRDVDELDLFLNKHNKCCINFMGDCIDGAQIFELEYDNLEKK